MAEKPSRNPIMVPVDFSPHAEAALVFAAQLATDLNAPLLVLHVAHDPGEAPGYYARADATRLHKIEDVAAEMLDEFMQKMTGSHPQLKAIKKARTQLVTGLPVTRILEVAEKIKPWMVVLGSQGRTGLSRLLLGSKAEQVVRLCPSPVTIIKMQPDAQQPES